MRAAPADDLVEGVVSKRLTDPSRIDLIRAASHEKEPKDRLTPFPRWPMEDTADPAAMVEARINAALLSQPTIQCFSDDMKPVDFEAFCAEELRRAGWNARVTMQSRDQGVDVIADKSNVRVVLQCKLYTSPVGNKAV